MSVWRSLYWRLPEVERQSKKIMGEKWKSCNGRVGALKLIHTYHAVPLQCRSAKGLDSVFSI
jgi:hypothetical protein